MPFNISDEMTLSDVHGHALSVMREIAVEEEKGTAVCRCCGAAKGKHINDGTSRCTLYATSRTFVNDRHEERQKALEAAELIEKLRSL